MMFAVLSPPIFSMGQMSWISLKWGESTALAKSALLGKGIPVFSTSRFDATVLVSLEM